MSNRDLVHKRNWALRQLEIKCVNHWREKQSLQQATPDGNYMRKAFKMGWEAAMRKAKKTDA